MILQTLTLVDEQATKTIAEQLANCLPSGLVLLNGDLGAGKTTLTRYWLRALGVAGAIKSPTYTLVETYKRDNGLPIFHFDLYRLNDPDELDMLGFDDYLEQMADGALILIEWPSKAGNRLPTENTTVTLTQQTDNIRTIQIKSNKVLMSDNSLTHARQGGVNAEK